jgi:Kef-type K+ transport system membrane component KefB
MLANAASSLTPAQTTGLMALMLLAALVGALAAARLRLPQIIGFLLAGLVLQWVLMGLGRLGAEPAAKLAFGGGRVLDFLSNLALAVVMFSIGLAFEGRRLRKLGATFLAVAGAQTLASFLLTAGACWVVAHLAGLHRPAVMAVLLGAVASAVSPAATLVTVRQYQARGRVTAEIMAATGLSMVAAVCLFDFLGGDDSGTTGIGPNCAT